MRKLMVLGAVGVMAALAAQPATGRVLATARPNPPFRLRIARSPGLTTAVGVRRQVAIASRTVADVPPGARVLGRAAARSAVIVTLSYRPQRAGLLAGLAERSSRSGGVAIPMLRRMFAPPSAVTRAAAGYLRSFGFHAVGGGILTRSYRGTVAGAEAAFGTRLVRYADNGVLFRSPARAPRLPAAVASRVMAVAGLDTYPSVHPLATRGARLPAALSSCAAAGTAQAALGGYQPGDLAAPAAYDFQTLLDGGSDGHGDSLALVEFSNYAPADVAQYQSCYGTSVPVTDVSVNGGTATQSVATEVELDEEVAATAAPGLDRIYTYIAAPTASFSAVVDQIVNDRATTHVNVVSISWGGCERSQDNAQLAADAYAFDLAAAAGMSVYASSGDDGSSGCIAQGGGPGLAVDFPASDPYVTAVGGTTLNTGAAGAGRETSWGTPNTGSGGGGGGGVSSDFPMPTWQTGTGVIEPGYSSHTACGETVRYCREVPDISLDGNPDTGYIVYAQGGWTLVGGTSAGAPLLAAMTADADSYSLAHSGGRLAFATPFFYANQGSPLFRDVTTGSNSTVGGGIYPAASGYDMSSGLGAPDGGQFASDLAAYTASPPTFDTTAVTAGATRRTITPTAGTVLHGVLTDTTTGLPLANRRVNVTGYYRYLGAWHAVSRWSKTGNGGAWSIALTTAAVKTLFYWNAAYQGEESLRPAVSATHVLGVMPALSLTSSARWTGGYYRVAHSQAFTLRAGTTPKMVGKKLVLQVHRPSGGVWHTTTIHAVVGANGIGGIRLVFGQVGAILLRWKYVGSATGLWRTATSPGRLFVST